MSKAALLVQLQLTDSTFPSGLYTLSHGLEGYTQHGEVDLPELLDDMLRHAVGPGDAAALALAHRAVSAGEWDRVVAVDERLHAIKLSREIRAASTRTGRQVLETARQVFATPSAQRLAELVAAKATPGNHAVVIGTLYAGLGVPLAAAVTGDLFAYASSWTGAAVRLRRLDFRQAQAVLYGAGPAIREATRTALAAREPTDVYSSAPMADMVSARHERARARLFST